MLGNVEVDDVAYLMKCSGCDGRSTLVLELLSPSAADRQSLTIRRVERIYYVRRIVRHDEPGVLPVDTALAS